MPQYMCSAGLLRAATLADTKDLTDVQAPCKRLKSSSRHGESSSWLNSEHEDDLYGSHPASTPTAHVAAELDNASSGHRSAGVKREVRHADTVVTLFAMWTAMGI